MTKDEFVERVTAIVESGKLDELDDLYDEIMGYQEPPTEVTTLSGRKFTMKWGTP